MRVPPGPDWTTFATRLEAHAKQASDAMLLGHRDKAIDHIYEAQTNLAKWVDWMLADEKVNQR